MDPFTIGIAAAGLGLNMFNSSNASDTANQNLQFQEQQAALANRLAQATRTDALGNTTSYDPATNTWKTTLSPMQKAINDAQQGEQYQELTQDAPRARSARAQAYNRAFEATPDYRSAIAGMMYDQPASEGSDRNTLESLMLQANQDKDLGNRAILSREAARMGKGGTIPALIKNTDDQLGSDLASTILQARQGGKQQRASDIQTHNAQYSPIVTQLQGILDDNGSGAPLPNVNTEQMLNAIQSSMAGGANSAFQSGSSNINSAAGALAKIQGKQFDVSPLIKALNSNTSSNKNKTATQDPTDPTVGDPFSITPQSDGTDWAQKYDLF